MLWPFLLFGLYLAIVIGLAWLYLRRRDTARGRLRYLPTRFHGFFDYLLGVLLIAAPWLMGFGRLGAETWVPVVLGGVLLLYSLVTKYEWGLIALIPVRLHLILDGVAGLLLFVSPLLFGFADEVMNPHFALGAFLMLVAFVTERDTTGVETAEPVGADTGGRTV